MHYYSFNIPDWSLATAHLSLEEEAVYFRLVNYYYDTEQCIPLETQSVIRRLRLGSLSAVVDQILAEFFTKTEKGFAHVRCDKEIKEYKKIVKKNRENGGKGGRPKKIKASEGTQSEPSGFPVGSQSEPSGNPNYYPLPSNQEPLPTTQPKRNARPAVADSDLSDAFSYWQSVMNKPTAKLTPKRERAVKAALKLGYTIGQIKSAIDGCKRSPWHQGVNPDRTVYDDLELICRNGENIEKFIHNIGAGSGVETIDMTQDRIQAQAERVAAYLEEYQS